MATIRRYLSIGRSTIQMPNSVGILVEVHKFNKGKQPQSNKAKWLRCDSLAGFARRSVCCDRRSCKKQWRQSGTHSSEMFHHHKQLHKPSARLTESLQRDLVAL